MKYLLHRLSTLMVCLSLFLVCTSSPADTLTVGLSELDYPPFYYTDSSGQLNGAAIEIAEALAEDTGHQLIYQRVPWPRLQQMLKVGSIDMVVLYFKTEEREQDVIYTRMPHLNEKSYLVVPTHMDVEFDGNLMGLQQYDFFNVRGYSHGREYDHARYLKKHDVNNETELLHRIASGRDFIGVGNRPALELYAEKENLTNDIRFLLPEIAQGANYIAFSRQLENARFLADQFSDRLETFRQSDQYIDILQRYGFIDYPSAPAPTAID